MIMNYLKTHYGKLKGALSKTQNFLGNKVRSIFADPLNETTLDQLEQTLYEADLGVAAAKDLTLKVKNYHQEYPQAKAEELIQFLQKQLIQMMEAVTIPLSTTISPLVILIVGVNGNGKTTTTAKLAKNYKDNGKKVLLCAADTFRAAAVEQLERWSHQLTIDLVKGHAKSDPAAVAFDALQAAKARQNDVVLIDTAGRLHTKTHLMQELEKIKKTCRKVIPESPHETFLVLDATTGQNAIEQAKIFHQFTPLSGIILTKLDGTAKGGIVFSIQQQLGIPIRFIGTGENIEDLAPFDAKSFVEALFGK